MLRHPFLHTNAEHTLLLPSDRVFSTAPAAHARGSLQPPPSSTARRNERISGTESLALSGTPRQRPLPGTGPHAPPLSTHRRPGGPGPARPPSAAPQRARPTSVPPGAGAGTAPTLPTPGTPSPPPPAEGYEVDGEEDEGAAVNQREDEDHRLHPVHGRRPPGRRTPCLQPPPPDRAGPPRAACWEMESPRQPGLLRGGSRGTSPLLARALPRRCRGPRAALTGAGRGSILKSN